MKKLSSNLIYILGGIILGILMIIFDVPLTIENMLYLFLAIFFFLLTMYSIYFIWLNKKFKKYMKDSNSNLKELEKSLMKIGNNVVRTNFLINLSVAYSVRNDYKEALRVLKRIEVIKMNEKIKVIYYNNLAYFLLKSGDILKASEILKENRKLFDKYLSDIHLASNLLITIEEIEKGNK